MPASLASLPGAVRKATERGVREGIRRQLTRPTVTFGTGATVFYVGYAMQKRKRRMKRMECMIDRLDDKTDAIPAVSSA